MECPLYKIINIYQVVKVKVEGGGQAMVSPVPIHFC